MICIFVKFKVVWFNSEESESKVDTGLVFSDGDECEAYMTAVEKLYNYYGKEIESIQIEPFAPDEPFKVSEEILDKLAEEVIW